MDGDEADPPLVEVDGFGIRQGRALRPEDGMVGDM